VVDTLLYVVKTGCQWRQFARRFPCLAIDPSAVSHVARQQNVGADRPGSARAGAPGEGPKRRADDDDPRFAVCEDGVKRGQRGSDAGKKIKGRKRHIAVDTGGNLLAMMVHSAGIEDRVAARAVLMRLFCRLDSIATVFVDGGYSGKLIG
jgi:putative transposase